MSQTYSKTRTLVECALMIALGTVLANIKIYSLANGGSVTLFSMLPFIIGDRESVILTKPENLRRGIIALAWVEQRRYVLHRIERIEGDKVTLMGDGNLVGREYCHITDVKAIATHSVDALQKRHYLYTKWRCAASEAWWLLRPIRRYILAIYKRMNNI